MGNFVQTYLVEEDKRDLVRRDRWGVVREGVVRPERMHHIAWGRWRAEGKWANCSKTFVKRDKRLADFKTGTTGYIYRFPAWSTEREDTERERIDIS